MNNLVGNQLGKYQLTRLLGHGGMAEVYEAFQPGTERSVAIKVLRGYGNETPESIARFKREARSIAQLRHTSIIQVFDFDVDHNLYYMVMEYIRGGTLSRYLHEHGALPALEAVRLTIQLADALAYAHQHGVIHRDIKPVNIMFADQEHKHPVLTDFGIARILGETAVTADGRMMGSPAYLSPEVALGHQADARSDIYGLGLTLYEMVVGRLPYTAADATSVVMQHLAAPLPPPRQLNPDVPQVLEIVLSKALSKTRERRYQSAQEFKLVLERLAESLRGQPVDSGETKPIPLNARPDSATTHVLPFDTPAEARTHTLPFDPPQDSRTRTMPFDAPVTTIAEPEAASRRRKPLAAVLILVVLLGIIGYIALTGNQTIAGDNPTPTPSQPALLVDAAESETPPPTMTETPTPSPTLTPTVTTTLDIPPVRENPFFRPTAMPSRTPTITPTVKPTNTNPPRPTQVVVPTQPVQPVETAPTNVPGGDGGSGGGGNGGGSGGSSNPIGGVVDGVTDTVGEITQPVQDIVNEILPLPTICLFSCG